MKRVGRPTTEPTTGKKHTLSLNASARLKASIQKAAQENGRSLSAEMEVRLERSFSNDALLHRMRKIVRDELRWSRQGD